MGLILKSDDKAAVMVFRKEKTWSGGTFTTYSISVSSKDKDDNWVKGFIDVSFKKGVEVSNKSKITIKNAFPIVTKGKDDRTFIKWMITDFIVVEEGEPVRTDEPMDFSSVGMDEELPFGPVSR